MTGWKQVTPDTIITGQILYSGQLQVDNSISQCDCDCGCPVEALGNERFICSFCREGKCQVRL
jgi:hypothetical protein